MGIKKSGELSHELEVSVPASRAWELYGTRKLAELAQNNLPDVMSKIVVHGDGGLGTIVEVNFAETSPGPFRYFHEKFTKVDDTNMIKETELIRGGYLDLGFTLFRIIYHIVNNSDNNDSCVIRSSVYYEYDTDLVSVPDPDSIVSTGRLVSLALAAKDHLTNTTTTI